MIKLANAIHVYVRVQEEIATLIAIPDSPDVIPIREMLRGLVWTHFVLFRGFEEEKESTVKNVLTEMHH